jgi:elongation factor G
MVGAFAKLEQEDPSFHVLSHEDTAQIVISGMGELHLEIIMDRLKREFNVDVCCGNPQVAYKETVSISSDNEEKFIRQTGGKGQYGHVWLRIEPRENGLGYEFVSKIPDGKIPSQFITAVDRGVQEQLKCGIMVGFPLVDIKVTLFDGSYHEVDSNEIAFSIAGAKCFREGVKKARPVLLEPIMEVEVVTPEEYMGDVVGDINKRRGSVLEIDDMSSGKNICCEVPLAEMFGYATDLRSATQGRATYSMHFGKYNEVPSHIAEAIVKKST